MRTLLVGNGAREHAIALSLARSPLVTELYCAPGNAGTASLGRNVPLAAEDIEGLVQFSKSNDIEFVVVGPEAPLAAGLTDSLQEQLGIPVFGPSKQAARIESSKIFAKEIMRPAGVPTGRFESFSNYDEAEAYVRECPLPIVIKADGLAAGKGVVVAQTREDALEAVRRQMVEKEFGAAGQQILVEECLQGPEVSVFAFVHGEYVSPMIAACDYKRAHDGDKGPNTGGMGSYSPPIFWDQDLDSVVRHRIMEPIAKAMCAAGSPYSGVLYAGLMLTESGPKVIEFNCRLGDPETQVVLPRLKSDLAEVMMKVATGDVDSLDIAWDQRCSVGVVVASGGYPGKYETGYDIRGLDDVDEDVIVFHAGTGLRQNGAGIATSGGRVLTVAALSGSLDEARKKAYENVEKIYFQDSYYRNDIALFS